MKSRKQNKQWWLGGGALVAIVIAAIGWFVVIEPQLSAAAATRDQLDTVQLHNDVLAASNARLKAQNDNIAALRADLSAALAGLPSDGGLPEFTRQLSAQATASSVVLVSVVVGAATAVAAPAADSGSAAGSGTITGSGTTGSGSKGTGTTGSSTTGVATSESALVQMTVTVTSTGLGADNLAFLQAIQLTGPRRALVTASQLAPAQGSEAGVSGPCTLTATLNIFSAPLSAADQAALDQLINGG